MSGHRIDQAILRAYDIRGTVGQTLFAEDARAIGQAFASVVRENGGRRVAVGRDGRVSSPMLEAALIEGLTAGGVDAVRTGLGPSPMLYHAEQVLEVDGGVQVTASHNPKDDNGFKLVLGGRPFYGAAIEALAARIAVGEVARGAGDVTDAPMLERYVGSVFAGYAGGAFRIGWDAGNGAAGPAIERLVQLLPGEHHLLFTDVDGHFPNHHPDPTEDANLAQLTQLVVDRGLDFGLAFDGDGDRIGAVDGRGRVVRGDQIMSILAQSVLRVHPGAPIIADVKTSQGFFDRVAALGGEPVMTRTGHSHIKASMRETGAPLAGELSGHIIFGPPDGPGYDDALLAAVRLIGAIHAAGEPLASLRDAMPETCATPDIRVPIAAERKARVIEEVAERLAAANVPADRTDGIRVVSEDGWWLLRGSNTQDMLTIRAEAHDRAGLDRLLAKIDEQLSASGVSRAGTGR